MRLTWLGHSTVVLDVAGARVLTDPLLRRHAGVLRRQGPQPSASSWQNPDVVLLSHLHHDHAEVSSLRLLHGVPLMSHPTNVAWLRRRHLEPALPLDDDWTPVAPGVEVRQVPAVHGHRPMPHRPNECHGHLLRSPSVTVWIAGDTQLYPGMAALPDLAGGHIDVALVPVWGWGPRLSGGHLTPEEAARAVGLTRARLAVPVHWGTLHPPFGTRFRRNWFELPGQRFADAVAEHTSGTTAVLLHPGQSWSVPAWTAPSDSV